MASSVAPPETSDEAPGGPRRAPAGFQRVRLTLAFDGSQYFGWQWQPREVSVQQKVEEALARLFPDKPRAHGSSRTDTGVHAEGLVAHFDAPKPGLTMAPSKLLLALNAHLPPDIRVMAAAWAPAGFHARFSASRKEYRYYIWNHPAHLPFWRERSWHVPRRLDLGAMRLAAAALLGSHDFRAFSASPGYHRRSTVRSLTRCDVRRSGHLVTLIFEADGFLYRMCRGLAGTLAQIGLGHWPAEEAARMLASRDRRKAGMTAPANGLALWRVRYARNAASPLLESEE